MQRGTDPSIEAESVILHASCVAANGKALLIQGKSGSGKSALALQLMALGAKLVSDDRTCLRHRPDLDVIEASAPDAIRGLIEARGVGVLRADPHPPCPVAVLVDLDVTETERLPEFRTVSILGQPVPLLRALDAPHFPAALMQFLESGRHAP